MNSNSNHYEVQPVQIDLKNFSVQTMAKANTIPNPLKPSPPSRPPPPRIARRGLLGRPIPIADQNGSIYTITVAKHSISAFDLPLRKQEPVFIQQKVNNERPWRRRAFIAGLLFLLLALLIIVLRMAI